jgi:WD40 repeat protein
MMPKPGSLNGLAWHPGSRWLAAGGSDDRIYVYDTQANVPYDVLEGHDDLVTALAWSPDGATLASTAGGPLLKQTLVEVSDGPDQTVRLWRWR